jgi:hypothetical protein
MSIIDWRIIHRTSVTHVGVSVGCWFALVEFRSCLVVFGLWCFGNKSVVSRDVGVRMQHGRVGSWGSWRWHVGVVDVPVKVWHYGVSWETRVVACYYYVYVLLCVTSRLRSIYLVITCSQSGIWVRGWIVLVLRWLLKIRIRKRKPFFNKRCQPSWTKKKFIIP